MVWTTTVRCSSVATLGHIEGGINRKTAKKEETVGLENEGTGERQEHTTGL